uniref:Bud22 domain-containing protein n=1 Tax=Leucosporidium scottii TaxID=5278 RepID=A0A0H5FTK0_9BASI|nr:hypothetical protein [Leucosporidium scottii]
MAPKRARDTEHASKQAKDAPAETDPAAQEASVKAYMFHAVKLLHKALKKSRTFETQKLARKLKQTKEPKEGEPAPDAAVVADLEAQLATLKNLPIDPIPPYILSTRLPKLPFLRAVAFLPTIISSLPTFPAPSKAELDPTTTDGKARNRTLANKAVKEAYDEVSRAVAKRMGEDVEERKEKEKPVQAKAVAAKPVVVAVPEVKVDGAEVAEGEPKPEKRLSKRAERAAKGAAKALLPKPSIKMDPSRLAALAAASDSEGEESEDEGPLSGSEFGGDDDEVARELARLGGSGSEGEWSGSEEGAQSDADDSGDEGFASDSSFPTTKTVAKPEKARKMKQASSSKPITSSSFLPTLAGGYISYSDSDGEDAKWVKDAEKGDKKERKNRRGQRARQAIWEKKYGSGANHVVKTTGGVAAAPKGKAAKKSKKKEEVVEAAPFDPRNAPGGSTNVNAQPLGVRKVVRPTITYQSKAPIVPVAVAKIAEFTAAKPSAPSPARGPGGRPARGGPPPPPKPAPSRVEEGMHPSWEAKRRAQEALANLAAAPKGKKITFD